MLGRLFEFGNSSWSVLDDLHVLRQPLEQIRRSPARFLPSSCADPLKKGQPSPLSHNKGLFTEMMPCLAYLVRPNATVRIGIAKGTAGISYIRRISTIEVRVSSVPSHH